MVLVHTFCLVFSLRLGALIIGTFTLIIAAALVIWHLHILDNIDYYRIYIEDKYQNSVKFQSNFFSIVLRDVHYIDGFLYWTIAFITFYFLIVFVSIIFMMGAYQCKRRFIYPFLFLYLMHIIITLLQICGIFAYIISVDLENMGLGMIILYFNLGFFVVVFYAYTWICIYSFVQVITFLEFNVKRKILFGKKNFQLNNMRIERMK